MANNLGRFILSSLLGGGQVRDYAHAARTFRSNGFSRAGKTKYLFHVVFNVNRSAGLQVPIRELSYMVKKIELPKFSVEAREMNQYNRKQLAQVKMKYQPVNITFHDDNGNQIRELWRSYYNYYYADGRYSNSIYNFDDKYRSVRLASDWGLNSGASNPFFSSIDIYSLHAGTSQQISLINPIITSFNHDTHDYSDGASLMEHQMQITYTSVKYQNGFWSAIPGFAESQFYDTTSSDLAGSYAGMQVDPSTGAMFQPDEYLKDQFASNRAEAFSRLNQQYDSANADRPSPSTANTNDIQDMLALQDRNGSQGYCFPTANYDNGIDYRDTINMGDVNVNQSVQAISENTILQDNNRYLGVFDSGTWQRQLEEKGYDPKNIVASEDTVQNGIDYGTINDTSQAAIVAEKFIENNYNVRNQGYATLTAPATDYPVSFANNSVIEPIYNANSWQQQLKQKGYQPYEITMVEDNIASVRLAPSIDLVSYAESYIRRNGK